MTEEDEIFTSFVGTRRLPDKKGCVIYESEEYSDKLRAAENAFNRDYCNKDTEKPYVSCITRTEHDGENCELGDTDLVAPVGLYYMGDEDSVLNMGLIVHGNKYGWFFLVCETDYMDGLKKERMKDL